MKSQTVIYGKSPHEDIENHVLRRSIRYFENHPDSGINKNTGLIFTISGFSWAPEHGYEEKLRNYLANKYNCIVIGVDYFGIWLKLLKNYNLRVSDGLNALLEKLFKRRVDPADDSHLEFISVFLNFVKSRNIYRLEDNEALINDSDGCYQTFGLLSALDYLQVMGEILEKYPVDKRRTYILGSSFGGYIGLMIGKLAPNSFRLIVDNSGFCEVKSNELYVQKMLRTNISDVSVMVNYNPVWSQNPESEHFFDTHHHEIRDMKISSHLFPGKTQYYCAHSAHDTLALLSDKEKFCKLKGEDFVFLNVVNEDKVDGRLFKNTNHGMNASLRGLFDTAYDFYQSKNILPEPLTDFDLESEYHFPCSNGYEYIIKFSQNNVCMSLVKPGD